jgi:hypothetical protein
MELEIRWSPRGSSVLAFLFAGLLLAGNASAAPGGATVKELTRAADFVFRGTVQSTGAANLSIVEPDGKTAVVRVEEVLKAGGTIDDYTGRNVTVFLSQDLAAGDQRVFFTQVRLIGESLGVQELERPAGGVADLAAQARGARSEIVRDELAARLAAADLVVSGRVLSTRPASTALELDEEMEEASEHDPQWQEAVLEVRSVLKGNAVEKTVTFLYPGSIDVMWAFVPKAKAGQTGTWLLHRHIPEKGAAVYVVADPKDKLSDAEARQAEGLVKP